MTLREKQSVFALNFAKLVLFAYENGYEITYGEAQRTIDQQRLYFEGYTLLKIGSALKLVKTSRKSKTMNGQHPKKLAHDINLFLNGRLLGKADNKLFKPLAEYWKSLHPKNTCGYYWNWDFGHFQMSDR
jgi:hypothetical protein